MTHEDSPIRQLPCVIHLISASLLMVLADPFLALVIIKTMGLFVAQGIFLLWNASPHLHKKFDLLKATAHKWRLSVTWNIHLRNLSVSFLVTFKSFYCWHNSRVLYRFFDDNVLSKTHGYINSITRLLASFYLHRLGHFTSYFLLSQTAGMQFIYEGQ